MNDTTNRLRDNNGRFTSTGNMIHELDLSPISDGDEHVSMFTHLKRLDDAFKDVVLMHLVGSQRTFIWEAAGKGYLAAACNQFVYAESFLNKEELRNNILFNAQHVRNFGLAYFGYADDSKAEERFGKYIIKLLDKYASISENATAEELLEIWNDAPEGESLTLKDAEDFIAEQRTYMSEQLRPRLHGFLDGARFDDLQDRTPGEWDERSATIAIRSAAHYVLSFFNHEEWGHIVKTKQRSIKAVMGGWRKEIKAEIRNELWIAREDEKIIQKFIDDHDLSYDS